MLIQDCTDGACDDCVNNIYIFLGHSDPMNGRVLQNVEKYERLLVESPQLQDSDGVLKRPNTTYLRTRNAYERLCQTQGHQVEFLSAVIILRYC